MEIYYCKKCRSRVSSYDVSSGKGMMTDDGEVYCHSCIKELGLDDVIKQKPKPARKKGTSKIRTTGVHRKPSSTAAGRTGTHRTTGIRRPVPGTLPPSRAQVEEQKKKTAGIVIAVVAAVLITGILIFAISRSGTKTQTQSSTPIDVSGTGTGTDEGTDPQSTGTASVPNSTATETITIPTAKLPSDTPAKKFPEADGWKTLISNDVNSVLRTVDEPVTCTNGHLTSSLSAGKRTSLEDKVEYIDYELGLTFAVSETCSLKLFFRKNNNEMGFAYIGNISPGIWHTFYLKIESNSCSAAEYDGVDYAGKDDPAVRVSMANLEPVGKTGVIFTNLAHGTAELSISEFSYRGFRTTGKQEVTISGTWKIKQGDDLSWKEPGFDDSDWTEVNIGRSWEKELGREFDGYAWYRKTVETPPVTSKAYILLEMNNIDNNDWTYINGTEIGHTEGFRKKRVYRIPGDLFNKSRPLQIAVRVFDQQKDGGIRGKNARFLIYDAEEGASEIPVQQTVPEPQEETQVKETPEPDNTAKPQPQADTEPGLKSMVYWGFEGTSASVILDMGELELNGVITGAQRTEGKIGNGMRFKNEGDRIEITKRFAPPPKGSIAFWIKPEAFNGNISRIIGGAEEFEIYAEPDGTIVSQLGWTGPGGLKSKTPLPAGEWTHVVCTWNTDTRHQGMFLNGRLKDNRPDSINTAFKDYLLEIGSRQGKHRESFRGILDEVYIFSKVLSAAEVKRLASGADTSETPEGTQHSGPPVSTGDNGAGRAGAQTVWIEGENPASQKDWFKHGWYHDNDIKPDALSGGSWLSHFQPKTDSTPEASYEFNTGNAEYTLWLRHNNGRSKCEFQLDEGEWKAIPGYANGTHVQITNKIDVRFLGWSKLETAQMTAGKHTLRFRYPGTGKWGAGIDCLCITADTDWKPDTTASKPKIVEPPPSSDQGTIKPAPEESVKNITGRIIFQDDFEDKGNVKSAWDDLVLKNEGNASTSNDNHSGKHSGKFWTKGGNSESYIEKNLGAEPELYIRFYMRLIDSSWKGFNSQSDKKNFIQIFGNNGHVIYGTLWKTNWGSDAFLQWTPKGGPGAGDWPGIFTQWKFRENDWTCVEIHLPKPGPQAKITVWVDGKEIGSKVSDLSDIKTWNKFQIGLMGKGPADSHPKVYFDDLVLSDQKIGQ